MGSQNSFVMASLNLFPALFSLYPEFSQILGPYLRPDGRKHLVAKTRDGEKTTISYPKALMEVFIGRRLREEETVDHIDRDKTNDARENLRVIPRSQHAREDALYVSCVEGTCAWCQKRFTLSVNQRNSRAGKAGPFCSRSCSGRYGASIQAGSLKKGRKLIVKNYFRKNKER